MGLDPTVVEKFHFTREAIEGPVYRKYEKAIRKFWSVEDLDFTQDARDWETIDDEQKRGLLGVTVRFLAGEQNVTNELVPMLAAAQALRRFDWTVYLSTFLMEEAKHAQFFMRWHKEVVGVRCRGRLGCVAYGRRIDRWQLPIISTSIRASSRSFTSRAK